MERELDKEWLYLIIQAKQMEIPIAEIRRFLHQRTLTKVSELENKNEVPFAPELDSVNINE